MIIYNPILFIIYNPNHHICCYIFIRRRHWILRFRRRFSPSRRLRGSGWGSWPRVSWIQSLVPEKIDGKIHGEIQEDHKGT
jgi:hypothetical protein